MRILVCGGRAFSDYDLLKRTLDGYADRITCLIHGCAPGADTLADVWARSQGRMPEIRRYPAPWATYGRAAGPMRNRVMLEDGKPDLVVAFQGGTGTANMVRQARLAGVEIVEVL